MNTEKIKNIREELEITQEDISKFLAVQEQHIHCGK